jgi:hypothetical protein
MIAKVVWKGLVIVVLMLMLTACQKENHAPVINNVTANPDSVSLGQNTTLTVDADDQDGDALTYNWSTTAGTLSSTSGQSVTWTAPNTTGNYSIHITAGDPDGLSDDADKTVKVYQAQIQDTIQPTVSITYPNNNDTIRQPSITITASASDNTGISSVEFYVDNNLIGTDYSPPYEQDWSITSYANYSSHPIHAEAYDLAGNLEISASVYVIVQNRGYVEGSNNGSYPIYDSTWTNDPVMISGAPAASIVDTVSGYFDITHTYPADLCIYLRSPDNTTLLLYDYGTFPGGFVSFQTTYFAGETVNGTWTLQVFDGYPVDEGSITSFYVGVDWKFQ